MIHKNMHNTALRYLLLVGPPSSPPITALLATKIMKHTTATMRKTNTEKPNSPAGTLYGASFTDIQYVDPNAHGRPRPKNTFTELDPVTLPIAASAYSEVFAAVIEANVSGKEVPRATREMAVTDSFRYITHPKTVAISPIINVINPIINNATKKHPFPPP